MLRGIKRLWECLTAWSVPPTSLEGVEAIVAHAAGENTPDDPGLVNELLADLIADLWRQRPLPVIVQGELVEPLRARGVPIAAASKRQAEAPHYLETRDIALWQRAVCDRLGVRRVVVVSFNPHYWRAWRATQRVGLIACVPPGIQELYDPRNSQKWGRSKWINRPYEVLARLYYLCRGWV